MLAIIPARGGSKGLPGKNIRPLAGKPLIAYTILAAKESPLVDRIVVSTDDPAIAAVAREFGAEIPFMRPAELATDHALAIDAYIYTVNRLKTENRVNIENLIVLQPTSPLRSAEDISSSITMFHDRNADSVVSVTEMSPPPAWAKRLDRNGLIMPYFPSSDSLSNRQELPTAFVPNGACYVFSYALLLEKRTYFTDKTFAYIMPKKRSIDIDDELDFTFTEYLVNRHV